MTVGVRIRGIYTTALTGLLLSKGIAISAPSRETEERFTMAGRGLIRGPADGEINDLEGKQGILVQGNPDTCAQTIKLIKENFLDVIIRTGTTPATTEVEFPRLSKSVLDEERNEILPTVFHHHRLKTFASESVDLMEKQVLTTHPEKRKAVSENLEQRLIWDRYSAGKRIAIEHVKPDGETLYLSEGELIEADFKARRLVLKRSQFKGRSKYDGLGVEKREGDYAITEAKEGDWFYQHTYLRRNGELIGWYFNINTPVEFYPDRIRYVDLEIDVVARAGGEVEIKDELVLQRRTQEGFLSERLREKAIQFAYELRSKFAYELRSKLISRGGSFDRRLRLT